jgi:hypothetical protein
MFLPVYLFIFMCGFVALFQMALAFGAPLGEYTLGGKFPGKLPAKMRIAALFQIMVLGVFVTIVLIHTDMVNTRLDSIGSIGIWVVTAFFVPGSILNISSPSKKERALWGPANVVMLALSLYIALRF